MVSKSGIQLAVKLLGKKHAQFIYRLALEQDKKENQWLNRSKAMHKQIVAEILSSLKSTGKANFDEKLVYEFLFSHYISVAEFAARSAEEEMEIVKGSARLAKPRMPKSLKELRELYDQYRKTGRIPKPFKDMGKKIEKRYLEKTQSVWRTYSQEYRAGDTYSQENVLRKVEKAADIVESRTKTIVRTETTNYYNKTRREIYDQSGAVSHYLFLAIRDQRTTKWCTDKVVNGKRGRHGLVYVKDDPLTTKETPACHWNCRSEMVPLSPFNPRHLQLIEDLSLRRRNNSCHPLPKGWSNAA